MEKTYPLEIRCVGAEEWLPFPSESLTARQADAALLAAVREDCAKGMPDMFEYRKVPI